MKKIIYFFILSVPVMEISAQVTNDIWRNTEVFRVQLKEKVNLPLRKLPVELIRAYCEGNIKAYFPQDSSKECSYHEFVSHFDIGVCQPDQSAKPDEFSGVPCPESFCSSNDESMLSNFLLYFDLKQVKRFDKNKSMEVIDVKYVALKYSYMKNDIEIVVEGPVFKYSDVAQLSVNFADRYKVPNPKNTAENFTMKKVIESRMFNGSVVGKKQNFKHPTDNKNKNNEKDVWNH